MSTHVDTIMRDKLSKSNQLKEKILFHFDCGAEYGSSLTSLELDSYLEKLMWECFNDGFKQCGDQNHE